MTAIPESLFVQAQHETDNDPMKTFTVLTEALRLAQADLREHTGKLYLGYPRTVEVTVSLQQWEADTAVELSAVSFNAAPAIDRILLEKFVKGQDVLKNLHNPGPDDLDEIFHRSIEMGLTPTWPGPFHLEVDKDVYRSHVMHVLTP